MSADHLSAANQLVELVELDTDAYRLTDFEVEFVDSVEKQTRAGREISPKQAAIISKTWDAVFIHGKRDRR